MQRGTVSGLLLRFIPRQIRLSLKVLDEPTPRSTLHTLDPSEGDFL